MGKSRGMPDLGVLWYLPGKKRPFASTTQATSYLIEVLAEDDWTWDRIAKSVPYDPDARAVAERFVVEGYGDRLARDFLAL